MMMSATSESTILPNAAPMMTPTARSTTLPLTANSRNSLMKDTTTSCGLAPASRRPVASDGCFSGLAGADPHDLLDCGDEDLAVTDLARARGAHDGLDGAFDPVVRQDDLDLDLRQEVDDVFGAAIELGVALL